MFDVFVTMKRTWREQCDGAAEKKSLTTMTTNHKGGFNITRTCFPMARVVERFRLKEYPYYRQPSEIGAFSLDIERNYLDNTEKMREYVPSLLPDPKLDLNLGFDKFIARDENVLEKLDHLLQWIKLHRKKFMLSTGDADVSCLNTDFITWRGHLVKILCTPFEKRDPWRMDACKYKGTIFISEVETETKRQQRLEQSDRQKEMCYWGYKFEDYMTRPLSGSSLGKESKDKGLDNCEAFCSVVRSRLKKHSLVFGAEVDCCKLKNGKILAPDCYLELKTTRVMNNQRLFRNFSNFKLIKYWAQSYLAGVPKVVCGMRDDNGIVRNIETFNTLDLPKIASEAGAKWDAAVCMNFCDEFLQWVKEVVLEDDHCVVYSFRYEKPFDEVRVERLPYGESSFLPDWFL